MKRAMVLWFTGLSGSGKTTIAEETARALGSSGKKVRVYDGDDVRKTLNAHLEFSPEDIEENNRIIARICRKDIDKYDYILVPVISPFKRSREAAAKVIGTSFRLVYVKASIAEVVRRDTKGLYKKAMAGEIDNFIGVGRKTPYEEPEDADLVIDTETDTIGASINKLLVFIMKNGKTGEGMLSRCGRKSAAAWTSG